MGKFNTKNSQLDTINEAGGLAYRRSDKLSFATIVLSSFLKAQYYKTVNTQITEIAELYLKIDPIFCAKTALYARNVFGMRSTSHLIAGLIARDPRVKGEKWTKGFFQSVIYRLDDMCEIVAYLNHTNTKIPNALKKGFAKVLEDSNEYSMAKYQLKGRSVSLVDIANLTHPRNTPAIAKLVKGQLKNTDTWEARVSAAGNDEQKKKDAWKGLISENKLGYLALIRNLRNIEQTGDVELIGLAAEQVKNTTAIKKSLVFPFQIQKASEQVQNRVLLDAISDALDISCDNVPQFDGKTMVAVDTSGSMSGVIKEAMLFAGALNRKGYDIYEFNNDIQAINKPSNTPITVFASNASTHGGTDFNPVLEKAKDYDRVIIISDGEGWLNNESLRKNAPKNTAIHLIDLQGGLSTVMPEKRMSTFAGFSEKIFDIMKTAENTPDALISEIENIYL